MKNNRTSIILMVALVLIGVYTIYNQTIISKQKKAISSMESKISELEEELETAENKIKKLEDDLSEVQHFDNDASVSRGAASGNSGSITFTGNVYETKIDGEFYGWDGETIFKMTDGSIWQQASYDYTYHYAYMPDVIIYSKNGSNYMKVEDMEEQIEVRRIK